MKKILATILSLAIVLSTVALAGCTKGGTGNVGTTTPTQEPAKTFEIALVTDVGNIDDKSFNQGAWEGVVKYAKDNSKTYAYYRPTEDSTAAREESIKAAIEKGAKILVCPGYLFEEAIYNMQTKYPDVQFLLLDGEPHTADYNTYKTESNVHCILYKEEQAGYFAGYAAVMEGYRKLGFLGGMDVPAVIRFGYGYVQGANAAAEKLGVTKDVSIKYWYCGGFKPTDDIKNKMAGWYTDGTEVVFSCGGGIYLSATGAAEAAGKKVIGVDVDQSAQSQTIITSAMKGLTNSVVLALTDLYKNNGKWTAELAGKTATLGVNEDCVGLPTAKDSWRMTKFTVEQYTELFNKVKSGEIVVSNDIKAAPKVAITVDYQK